MFPSDSSFSNRRSVVLPNDGLGIENGTIGAVRFGQDGFLAPRNPVRPAQHAQLESPAQNGDSVPSLLFGNRTNQKRKSLALSSRQQPNKNVHWSPNLVNFDEQARPIRPEAASQAAPSLQRRATVAGTHSWNAPSSTASRGPPLRSMLNAEPPVKQQKVDKEVEIKEAFQFQGRSEDPSDYWVTVFGFDPEDRDVVLSLFSRHANVVSHRIPEKGNWVHLRYSAVVHAQQALKRSGYIIGDRVKIGVEKCTEQDVLDEETANPLNMNTSHVPEVTFDRPAGHNDSLNSTRFSLNQSINSTVNHSRLSILSRSGIRRAYDGNASLNTSQRNDSSFLDKLWSFVNPQ